MNVLDLFSGIGGFSLGLERAGMRTVAFCEIEPFCRKILAKNFPGIPCYDDVRTLTADRLRADGISVDVICGGFPCQDISTAGKGAGIGGARSGLWSEFARIIGEVRPCYVIVENVSALLGRGLERVLGDLAALGYDAEWHCIPASAVGAPHRRDRVWIVGYPDRDGQPALAIDDEMARLRSMVADANSQSLRSDGCPGDARPQGCMQGEADQRQRLWPDASAGGGGSDVADAARDVRAEQATCRAERERAWPSGQSIAVADADGAGRQQQCWGISVRTQLAAAECSDWWRTEPDVGRVAHGVPARVDRLRSLGNAVVPQIPELIGRAIMSAPEARLAGFT